MFDLAVLRVGPAYAWVADYYPVETAEELADFAQRSDRRAPRLRTKALAWVTP